MTSMNAETTDMIIDFLHEYPYALKSCSLVCRSWLPASRFHLFRSITLESHSERYNRNGKPHPSNKLLAVIQQNPHIATLIRELHIRQGQDIREQDWINEAPGLPLLLKSLSRLTTLHLRRVAWIWLTPELREAFRNLFSSSPIANVDLELCQFPFPSFVQLISMCQFLKSLILRETTTIKHWHMPIIWPTEYEVVSKEEAGYPGEREETSRRGKCRLNDLRIMCYSSEVISWVVDPNGIFDLSRLRVLHCHAWSSVIKTLLLELGGSIQHLFLNAPALLPYTYDKEHREVVEYLEIHTALRSLHVNGIKFRETSYVGEEVPNPIRWLKGVVQSILDASHLQEIVVEVDFYQDIADIDWNAWNEFDKIFDGNLLQAPDLRKVEFNLYNGKSGLLWEDCRKKVANVLKGLGERKLLVIT